MATYPFRMSLRRARAVFGPILHAFERKQYPFNRPDVVVPHVGDHIPQSIQAGSLEESRLLFFFCSYMKGGIDSTTAIHALSRLYDARPELFEPKYVAQISAPDLEQVLKEFQLGFSSRVIAEHWIENAKRLEEQFGGDPRNIFEGVRTFAAAARRLQKRKDPHDRRGFLGFGPKMVSMLIYFYMDAEIIPHWHFPPPIDIHWLRIMVAHRIIQWADGHEGQPPYNNGSVPRDFYQPDVLRAMRRLLVRYTRVDQIDPIVFSDAIWLLARGLCFENPGNWFLQIGEYKARKTLIEHRPVVWHARQVKAFSRSCAQCPAHRTCALNVPSMPYYRHGRIVVMGQRTEPPQAEMIRDFHQRTLFPDDL